MPEAQKTPGNTGILAVSRAGEGSRCVILLHGWSCRRSHWQALMSDPPEGVSLLAVDLPGHGDSADVDMDEWTVAALGQVVADLVDAEPAEDVVLVGHSMGGAVVMEAARRLDRPAGVVLVDTFVIPYGDLDEETARSIETPFHEDFAAAMDNLVEQNVVAEIDETAKNSLKSDMAGARQDAMLPLWSDLLRWSPEPAFAEIRCPIHAINGDLIPDVARERCKDRVTTWHIPGAGHFPQQEMPREFRETLVKVLDRLD